MLFNSYIFIFVFVPVTLAGFWALGRAIGRGAAMSWLVVCSLAYYGYWNPVYLGLIVGSMLFNFGFGYVIGRAVEAGRARKAWTVLSITGNLLLLGYFKYANFFVDSFNSVIDSELELAPIVLPLAISFFTFQQIAYLVDAYKGMTHEYSFRDYALFVSFFPQLIAGPIVHHKQMMPQFAQKQDRIFSYNDFAGGITLFTLGLFKKVLIADSIARYANPAYDALAAGQAISTVDAWLGVLAYTFQLYFDFSGYSDMAIGLGLLFGIRLPMNFNSPYKSRNVGEFWRRWHITLGHFLRDYLYIPLGGSRSGLSRQFFAAMATMSLSGLWHGAGWTFVLWGFQHGLFYWIYLTWAMVKKRIGFSRENRATRAIAVFLTFAAWTFSMVLFRAENMATAMEMYKTMFGFSGWDVPSVMRADRAAVRVTLCALIVWTCPNTQQIMALAQPVAEWVRAEREFIPAFRPLRWLVWRPNLVTAAGVALLAVYTVMYIGRRTSEFLYFQF